jgi:hypothetical protein
MATTTTNFGWDIPQSTDLVKDGATAIAALGQDIDTALIDLKGGTTGQVLAKASGTDLDFSWVGGGSGFTLLNTTTFTASSAVNVDSIFSSTYRNYRIVVSYTHSVNTNLQMRLRASGNTLTTANYGVRSWTNNGSALNAEISDAATFWIIGSGGVSGAGGSYDIYAPNVGTFITMTGNQMGSSTGAFNAGMGTSAWYDASYTADGFQLLPASGTLTGTVRVYGYAN